MGDAISHAVLPGVVLAYVVGLPLAVGAFTAGMVCALASGYLKENSRIKEDTVMGIVFSGMFGLGIVLYTKIETEVHLDHILFGDILGVGWSDVLQSGTIASVVLAAVVIKWRDLLLNAFDSQQARAIGLPVRLLHYGLLSVLSLTIVGALKATGIVLTIAMLIAPGAIAFLLTDRFGRMLGAAVAVAVFRISRCLHQLLYRQCTRADDRPAHEHCFCGIVPVGGKDKRRASRPQRQQLREASSASHDGRSCARSSAPCFDLHWPLKALTPSMKVYRQRYSICYTCGHVHD